MKINSIKIENFLSIEDVELNFDDYQGIINIVGKNYDTNPASSNGAGKSSIIEAIVFALFGKTVRKTSEKSISNFYTDGKCKVTLIVNDNIEICRTKKPPSLHVSIDGKSQTKEGIQHTQAFLETLLNINYNVFLASIVFGQQNDMNFLTATPEEKRSIIQNFLNVTDLFKYRSKIRSIKAKHNNDKKIASTLEEESSSKIKKLKAKIEQLKSSKKKFNSVFSKTQLKSLSKISLSEIKELEVSKQKLSTLYSTNLSLIKSLEGKSKSITERLGNLKDNSECEHCGNLPQVITSQISKDKSVFQEVQTNLQSLKSGLPSLKGKIKKIQVPINSKDFESLEDLKTVDVKLDFLNKQIQEQRRVSKKYSEQVQSAQRKYDIMRFWETAFSEQGLIKYIIRHILKYLNERSNYYLGLLTSGKFSITFDEVLAECISNNGSEVLYESMSGGEKKKVSLAVMLSLNDLLILSGKERSNLLFFDEVADSLDKEGVKGLCELMEVLSEDKKVFIITHNEYMSSLIQDNANTLTVSKRNKITKIKKKK